MTRKNYVAISEILKNVMGESHLLIPLVNTLSNYFKDDNSKFSEELFKNACLNSNVKKVSEDKVLKKINIPVKAKLHPQSTTIKPNTSGSNSERLAAIISGADIAMKKMTKSNEESSNEIRKKDQG
jgi:hypothetical protein